MNVIGVDPGLSGALALLGDGVLEIVDMPVVDGRVNPWALAETLVGFGPVDRVAVERQQAYPRQGLSSAFKTGVGFGVILGVLAVLERPVVEVSASVWTRRLGVGADKGAHRRRAMETWPAHARLFARVKDDGRADACLIAAWCRATLSVERVA